LSAAGDPRKADAATLKARDDAIVRNALKGGEPVVVIVLGASHDLLAGIRAADPNCGYIATSRAGVHCGLTVANRPDDGRQ
jgi:hypothetical protein